MIEMWGFCNVARTDEPLDADGWCRLHNMVGIPPSWGSKDQRFRDGTWVPYKPRPEGYVYTAKYSDDPSVKPVAVSTACGQCGRTFSYRSAGGSTALYCSSLCKGRAARERRRAQRAAAS